MSISWERRGQVMFVGSLSFVAIESGRKGIFRERSTLERNLFCVTFSLPVMDLFPYEGGHLVLGWVIYDV